MNAEGSLFWILGSLLVLGGLLLLPRLLLTRYVRSQIYRGKPAEGGTPAAHGLSYQEHWIQSGDHRLQAWYVEPPAEDPGAPSFLLFQGGDDVIGELGHVQKYLFDHGYGSFVFDYGGNGRSIGQPSASSFRRDSRAAYELFTSLVGDQPKYLWGFSAGTLRLMMILPEVQAELDSAFLVGPFASLRQIASDNMPFPDWVMPLLLPDDGNNEDLLTQVHQTPVTIVHSRDDELAPVHHAHKLESAGGENVELALLDGLLHNDCWDPIHDAYWEPVFSRLGQTS
ncbi:MAG: alpha/beta hydrolase [Anaerolineales bacterium]